MIPSPGEQAGEVPKALVVLKGEVTPDEISDTIPKTASGKILRRLLVQREREQAKAGVTSAGGAG